MMMHFFMFFVFYVRHQNRRKNALDLFTRGEDAAGQTKIQAVVLM